VNPVISLFFPASFYTGDVSEDRLFLLYVGLFCCGGLVPCTNEPAEFD